MTNIQINFASNRYSKFSYTDDDLIRIEKSIFLLANKKKVLDVGCGDGQIGKMIKDKFRCEVFGIDVSMKSLELAKKNGLKVKRSRVEEKFPFASNSFDAVYAGEIIEHLFNPDAFIKEINRVLKKGGLLILTTPNLVGLGARVSVFLGKTPWMVNNRLTKNSAGHIKYFTPKEIKSLLEDDGFKVLNLTSDIVKLNPFIHSSLLARLFPNLGLHIIVGAKKLR